MLEEERKRGKTETGGECETYRGKDREREEKGREKQREGS